MSAVAVSEATWETEVLKSDRPVLVDFWAEWCGPCRMVSPIVDEIASDKGGALKVVKLNIDENPDITRKYQVMSIPTLMLFADGQERKRIVGAKGKSQILAEVDAVVG